MDKVLGNSFKVNTFEDTSELPTGINAQKEYLQNANDEYYTDELLNTLSANDIMYAVRVEAANADAS